MFRIHHKQTLKAIIRCSNFDTPCVLNCIAYDFSLFIVLSIWCCHNAKVLCVARAFVFMMHCVSYMRVACMCYFRVEFPMYSTCSGTARVVHICYLVMYCDS